MGVNKFVFLIFLLSERKHLNISARYSASIASATIRPTA